MSGVRFTAWFSEKERQAIRKMARDMGTSDNFVVRSAVRKALGMNSNLERIEPQPQQLEKPQQKW